MWRSCGGCGWGLCGSMLSKNWTIFILFRLNVQVCTSIFLKKTASICYEFYWFWKALPPNYVISWRVCPYARMKFQSYSKNYCLIIIWFRSSWVGRNRWCSRATLESGGLSEWSFLVFLSEIPLFKNKNAFQIDSIDKSTCFSILLFSLSVL